MYDDLILCYFCFCNFRGDCMYRRALAMEHERMAQETFIGRVGNLPIVNSAWSQVITSS